MSEDKYMPRHILITAVAALTVGLLLGFWGRGEWLSAEQRSGRNSPVYDGCLASGKSEQACDAAVRVYRWQRQQEEEAEEVERCNAERDPKSLIARTVPCEELVRLDRSGETTTLGDFFGRHIWLLIVAGIAVVSALEIGLRKTRAAAKKTAMESTPPPAVMVQSAPTAAPAVDQGRAHQIDRTKGFQILVTVACVASFGALQIYRTLNPDPGNGQAVIDVTYHPFASALGAIVPVIVVAPIAYLMFGRIFRRFAGQGEDAEAASKKAAKPCQDS